MRRALFTFHPLPLEPEVLQGFGCAPVQLRSAGVVPPSCREIPLRNPHCRTMAGGLELLERVLCLVEHRLSFVEPTLLEQRAAEHQLRVADLVEEVLAAVQQRQCVTCVLFSD